MTAVYLSAPADHWLARAIFILFMTVLWTPLAATAQVAEMVGPLRIAESPAGLIVGDYVGRQVLFLDSATLEITESLPVYTDETLAERGKPLSVGWMNNRLYIGEERTGLIQVWEYSSGKNNPKSKGKSKDAGWVQVSDSLTALAVIQPSAIVADESRGLLFVASKGQHSVLVLDEAGNILRTIGDPGSTAPLGNPQSIALDRVGQRVFVSDDGQENCSWSGCAMASVVQVYDYDGLPLGSIDGNSGNAGYKFSRAQGVAIDASGRVYLADSYINKVMVFEENAPDTFSALGMLGEKGTGPGQLLLATGVHIGTVTSGIYVANTMLARIEVFGMEDLVQ